MAGSDRLRIATPSSSPSARPARRAARRISRSPSGAPDSATRIRSRPASGSVPGPSAPSGARRSRSNSQVRVSSRRAASTGASNRRAVAVSRASAATMLPWARRRRRAAGDMSTISIWSAPASTVSGTRSGLTVPVSWATVSTSDSTEPMSTVATTSIPAASSSSASSQLRRSPGRAAAPRSSRSTTSGRRATMAAAVGATVSRPIRRSAVRGRPLASAWATTTSVPRWRRRWPSSSIATVLPTPGKAPR